MKTPRKTSRSSFTAALLSVFIVSAARAEIVFLAPPSAQIPPGAWVANASGITNGTNAAGYALRRSQAWRMQNSNSTPSAQNYWLVLPGVSASYGYSPSTGQQYHPMSENASNTHSHVSRANAYRMELFKR